MHDICKELYSKPSEGIEARSVNLEDFENAMTDAGKAKRDGYIYSETKYGQARAYTGGTAYYPNLYAKENGSGIGVEIESTDTEEAIKAKLKKDGIGVSAPYYTSQTEEKCSPESTTSDSKLTVTQTYYEIYINEENFGKASKVLGKGSYYWLASRSAYCYSSYAFWSLRLVGVGGIFGESGHLVDSDKYERTANGYLRPVVFLKSSVRLELTEEGKNSQRNPHKIINY